MNCGVKQGVLEIVGEHVRNEKDFSLSVRVLCGECVPITGNDVGSANILNWLPASVPRATFLKIRFCVMNYPRWSGAVIRCHITPAASHESSINT